MLTNEQARQAFINLQIDFPSNETNPAYWNHVIGSPNNPNAYTSFPCTHHGSGTCNSCGTCGCNAFGGAYQCFGFAIYMANRVFSSYPYWSNYEALSGNGGDCHNGWKIYKQPYCANIMLEEGDIVRTGHHNSMNGEPGHSVIVTSVINGVVSLGECVDNCKIVWRLAGKSMSAMTAEATFVQKAPKNRVGCIVVFYSGAGVCPIARKTVYIGDQYGTLPTPTRTGYVFDGWWNGSKRITASTIVTETATHILTAHWTSTCHITSVGAFNKCISVAGSGLTSLTNGTDVVLKSRNNTANEQRWVVSSFTANQYVKSAIDIAFGLNVYRSGSPYNCNIFKVAGNETDAAVDFIDIGDDLLKIKLHNYNLYLTLASSDENANVYWAAYSGSDLQKWLIN